MVKKVARQKTKLSILATGISLTLVLAFSYIYQPLTCKFLNNKLYDLILQRVHKSETSGIPVIIDLDDESLERFGQWPWPRYRVGQLMAKLQEAGVLSIGTDILFAERDRTSPINIKKELKRDLQIDVNFTGLSDSLMDNDRVLAEVMRDGPYVLGYFFNFKSADRSTGSAADIHPLNLVSMIAPGAGSPHEHLMQASGLVAPLKSLADAARTSGFFNTMTDEDGIVRRTPLIISWQGEYYPSLSLATLQTALGKPQMVLKTTKGGIESLKIGSTLIPLDRNGRMLIHFRGKKGSFPYYSAGEILDGKIGTDKLKGRIALVGTSAAGLKDLRASPLDPLLPGAEAHATVIDNILTGDFFSRPNWAPGLEFCLILLCGLITTVLITLTDSRWTLPVSLVSGIIIWQGGMWFMESFRIFVSPLFPILTLGGNFSLLTLLKFWQTEREKLFFRDAFSRYVSKAVVDQIADSPDKLSLDGEEKELSILFSDIRSFTSLSENLAPNQVIELLHQYFTPMTKVITNNFGTLDKFIGDAIMAFWNAPVDVINHKEKAVRSGIGMLRELGKINKSFREKYGFDINIGIGLHAGTVRVGNMGTDELFDYTIIGDNVNLASRLEGLTNYYGVRIILSETMIDHVPQEFSQQELDLVTVKGRAEPLKIYGLFSDGEDSHKKNELVLYHEALQKYRQQKFSEAEEMFAALRNDFFDRKLYSLYEKRCQKFLSEPPPEEWDGVFGHTSK